MQIIDLTHTVRPNIPNWSPTNSFTSELETDYDQVARQHIYHIAGKAGTHIDSPSHFIPGGADIASLDPSNLIGPLVVLTLPLEADGLCTAADINTFESEHGSIPSGALFFLNTGWYKRWNDPAAFRNPDADEIPQNPGVALAAAELLFERGVVGIGVDSINVDGPTPDHAVHHFWLGHGRWLIENLTNLDAVPPTGATGIVLPPKIEGGSEAPIRALAIVDNN